MKELVGKVIQSIQVSNDQHFLKFTTNEGDLLYYAEGDCCSESWFADIVFDYKFDNKAVVTKVEGIDVPDFVTKLANTDQRTRQEYDQVYGYKITQSNGHSAEVIFRNSSNGYYGGWCELVDPNQEWHTNVLAELTWEVIESDWRA